MKKTGSAMQLGPGSLNGNLLIDDQTGSVGLSADLSLPPAQADISLLSGIFRIKAKVTARRAAECDRSVPAASNPAKALAARLVGCLPLVWGSEGIAGAAAYRLKCQLNENAKVLAGWATFPELNHNEVVGLYRPGGDVAPNPALLGVVVLRHEGEPPRTARRIDVTRSLVSSSVKFVEDVWARGTSPLARLLDLVTTGDHASTYLGIIRGVDPAPIAAIDTLKAALR